MEVSKADIEKNIKSVKKIWDFVYFWFYGVNFEHSLLLRDGMKFTFYTPNWMEDFRKNPELYFPERQFPATMIETDHRNDQNRSFRDQDRSK